MNNQQIINNYLQVLEFGNNIKTLEDITKLIQAHVKTFAFSSLKVLLKEEISLELQDIYESLVVKKRGGYCFEHNKLLFEVLKTLGFDVEFYLARVINNSNDEVPQTHRFTLLNLNDIQYIIDVGIGFRSPTSPIEFSKKSTKTHLGICYNVESFEKSYSLQIVNEKNEQDNFKLTQFDLAPCNEADFEMGHFYSHKHPCASFVNNLVVSVITKNEIHSLRNSDYWKIHENQEEKIEINSLEQFETLLFNDFKVRFNKKEAEYFYNNYVKKKRK